MGLAALSVCLLYETYPFLKGAVMNTLCVKLHSKAVIYQLKSHRGLWAVRFGSLHTQQTNRCSLQTDFDCIKSLTNSDWHIYLPAATLPDSELTADLLTEYKHLNWQLSWR